MTANRGLMLSLFFALLFILLSILPARVCAQQIYEIENPKREVRAVWLTTISGLDWPRTRAVSQSGIERQKRELVDILDKLQQANINTVLLQTRIRGTVIYPSSIEPWDECLTGRPGVNPGYDPLAFAVAGSAGRHCRREQRAYGGNRCHGQSQP